MCEAITIIIKSFNRPYYIDRCIQSIQQNVKGRYHIKVLDDGTPEKYLNKIREKYLNVDIQLSAQYPSKIQSIQKNIDSGEEINGFEIPTYLWRSAVENSADYFLMIEDDVWFIDKINLEEIADEMKEQNVQLVKLGWLGNFEDDKNVEISSISQKLDRIIPQKLFTANEFVMDLFMYNKFKFFTILYKLGWVDNQTKRKYWALNSILMGFWHKDYWLHIWKDAQGKVDEKQQLRNAATWYHTNKNNKNLISRTKKEVLKTTFQSSATNSYHKYGNEFDVNQFNHQINEAWWKGDFNAMQNFPQDFSMDYFEKFIDEKINKQEFQNWVAKFKQQYRNLGAEVD